MFGRKEKKSYGSPENRKGKKKERKSHTRSKGGTHHHRGQKERESLTVRQLNFFFTEQQNSTARHGTAQRESRSRENYFMLLGVISSLSLLIKFCLYVRECMWVIVQKWLCCKQEAHFYQDVAMAWWVVPTAWSRTHPTPKWGRFFLHHPPIILTLSPSQISIYISPNMGVMTCDSHLLCGHAPLHSLSRFTA